MVAKQVKFNGAIFDGIGRDDDAYDCEICFSNGCIYSKPYKPTKTDKRNVDICRKKMKLFNKKDLKLYRCQKGKIKAISIDTFSYCLSWASDEYTTCW
jgi:hypothetical protein